MGPPADAARAALAAASGNTDLLLRAGCRLLARLRCDPTEIGRRTLDTIAAALMQRDRTASG